MAVHKIDIELAGRTLSLETGRVAGLADGAGYVRDTTRERSVGLVRDPVCGVFVVPGSALSDGTGTSTRYFCSEDCRRKWIKR